MIAPREVYESNCSIWILFDTDDEPQRESLHEMRAVLQEYSDIEALSERFFVLILAPGTALRLLP